MNADFTDPSATATSSAGTVELYSVALPPALAAEHLPPGSHTCWSFLDDSEPWTLSLMADPITGLADDERRARLIAKEMGVAVVLTPAPDALVAVGVSQVGAYPAAVLDLVFPVNP